MTDIIIENAIVRRDAALAEARRWDEFIRMASELAGSLPKQSYLHVDEGQTNARLKMPEFETPIRPYLVDSKLGARGTMAETEAEVIEVLTALGRPAHTRELLKLLLARNFVVGGQDPASTLSARLSRAPRLKNVPRNGWWMKEKADDTRPAKEMSSALFQLPSGPVKPEARGGT